MLSNSFVLLLYHTNKRKTTKECQKMIKVQFYSAIYQKEITKQFENVKDAFEFARKTNGIVVA